MHGPPKSEADKIKFQELVLCPRNDRDQAVSRDEADYERFVAAAAVKATTIASRNRKKFCVPVRDVASEAAKCRNPVMKEELRREFEAEVCFPGRK